LDALEAFLGANPSELVTFTETPFGDLLKRVNQLGFDGHSIQKELDSTGVVDPETWITPVDLELAEFMALSPLEYVDRYPEHGAPLVATILNSIHLSDEQASLSSIAGGTNLSVGGKVGIVAAAAAITGIYAVPRIYNHLSMRSIFVRAAEISADNARTAADGFRGDFGVARLKQDFMGINHLNITADSFSSRFKLEWNMSGLGYIGRFKPDPAPDPGPQPDDRLSQAISELDGSDNRSVNDVESVYVDEEEGNGPIQLERFINRGIRRELISSVSSSERFQSFVEENVERAEINPFREGEDLAGDLRNVSVRPKSMEVVMNNEFDGLALKGLRVDARTVLGNPNLEAVAQGISDDASNMLSSEIGAVSQELEGFESEAQVSLDHDAHLAKSGIDRKIDGAVTHEEATAYTAAENAEGKAEKAISTDAKGFEVSVKNKVDRVIEDAENSIDERA
jgi:hypothetical protein